MDPGIPGPIRKPWHQGYLTFPGTNSSSTDGTTRAGPSTIPEYLRAPALDYEAAALTLESNYNDRRRSWPSWWGVVGRHADAFRLRKLPSLSNPRRRVRGSYPSCSSRRLSPHTLAITQFVRTPFFKDGRRSLWRRGGVDLRPCLFQVLFCLSSLRCIFVRSRVRAYCSEGLTLWCDWRRCLISSAFRCYSISLPYNKRFFYIVNGDVF